MSDRWLILWWSIDHGDNYGSINSMIIIQKWFLFTYNFHFQVIFLYRWLRPCTLSPDWLERRRQLDQALIGRFSFASPGFNNLLFFSQLKKAKLLNRFYNWSPVFVWSTWWSLAPLVENRNLVVTGQKIVKDKNCNYSHNLCF